MAGSNKLTPEQAAAREYLMRARRLEMRIRQMENLMRRVLVHEVSGVAQVDPAAVRASGVHRPGEQFALLSAEIDEAMAELDGTRAETLAVIHQVHDHVLAALLLAYYLNGLSWAEAARDMRYNGGYLRGELHRRALDAAWAAMREIGADEKLLPPESPDTT